ncbi:MAG: site-specific integrase [Treponema sp.]|jgi:integrase|nr:site-specific integrase [Treponema sp.]
MNAYPFSIFKRADRTSFSVSFKDANGKYLRPISTGKKTEAEAREIAFKWLRDGIPQKETVLSVNDLSMKDLVRKIKDGEEAEILLTELKKLGWVKSYVHSETPGAVDFLSFLVNFWDWDNSPYIKEKKRKNHGIHKRHCMMQSRAIPLYWENFFKGRFLGDITATDIDAFINFMGDMDLSASRKNVVIKAGTKPLRWAFSKGLIEKDPTRGHTLFAGDERKREILTPTAASAVFRAVWEDDRIKLANMLAAVTGMRNGEILALRFQDLGSDCIYVRSSWNKADGMKLPKNNETRTVEIPFPDLMNGLIEQAKQNPWGISPDSLVFWSTNRKTVPMQGQCFGRGLREALIQIGFNKEEADKFTFHGWRHFYTSYMISKLDKKLLKSQTGHKTDVMLTHYGNHRTDGDRETIQAVERETFAGLLPERSKISVFNKDLPLAVAS